MIVINAATITINFSIVYSLYNNYLTKNHQNHQNHQNLFEHLPCACEHGLHGSLQKQQYPAPNHSNFSSESSLEELNRGGLGLGLLALFDLRSKSFSGELFL